MLIRTVRQLFSGALSVLVSIVFRLYLTSEQLLIPGYLEWSQVMNDSISHYGHNFKYSGFLPANFHYLLEWGENPNHSPCWEIVCYCLSRGAGRMGTSPEVLSRPGPLQKYFAVSPDSAQWSPRCLYSTDS